MGISWIKVYKQLAQVTTSTTSTTTTSTTSITVTTLPLHVPGIMRKVQDIATEDGAPCRDCQAHSRLVGEEFAIKTIHMRFVVGVTAGLTCIMIAVTLVLTRHSDRMVRGYELVLPTDQVP